MQEGNSFIFRNETSLIHFKQSKIILTTAKTKLFITCGVIQNKSTMCQNPCTSFIVHMLLKIILKLILFHCILSYFMTESELTHNYVMKNISV